MGKYLVRRIMHLIPVLIIVSVILFTIVKKMPGDPVTSILGEGTTITQEKREQIERLYGLDKSLPVQYGIWVKMTLTGELGDSIQYRIPVSEVMKIRIMNSFKLNVTALFLAILIAVPIGVTTAVKKYSLFDNAMTTLALIGVSVPSFFLALLLVYVLAIQLQMFPMNGMKTVGTDYTGFTAFVDTVKHMVLPTIVLSTASVASITRYIRSSMSDIIKQDYIRTARSKGLNERVVIYKHAFRNALVPVVTLIIMMLPSLFGGSIVVEKIFSWPGIGSASYIAVMNRDYNLVLAVNLFFVLLMLGSNLLADIVTAFLDPRIKLD